MTTIPQTLFTFFQAQTAHLQASGFDVVAVSSPGQELDDYAVRTSAPVHGLAMTRRLTPFRDLYALGRITWFIAALKPDIVHTHTPKAGLLGMLGGWLNRVRVRIYTINGLPWLTRKGWRRALLQYMERVACSAATQVLCVSESVRKEALSAAICPAHKLRVLGKGGSHGVNPSIFDPFRFDDESRRKIRRTYMLDERSIVVVCAARLVPDKGIGELMKVWDILSAKSLRIQLLIAGAIEAHDPIPNDLRRAIVSHPSVRLIREKPENMPSVYAAADMCVLPSHREGLPNVALEAAAMRLPVIAFRVCGCTDAIRHLETGILVPLGDIRSLAESIEMLAKDQDLRSRMGASGRKFIIEHFAEADVAKRLNDEYRRLLGLC